MHQRDEGREGMKKCKSASGNSKGFGKNGRVFCKGASFVQKAGLSS